MKKELQPRAIFRWDEQRGELVMTLGACQHRLSGVDMEALMKEIYAHRNEVSRAMQENSQELPMWAQDYRLRVIGGDQE